MGTVDTLAFLAAFLRDNGFGATAASLEKVREKERA
jgi:hypothetical protein